MPSDKCLFGFLSQNVTARSARKAVSLLCTGAWLSNKTSSITDAERAIGSLLGAPAILTDSGRSALYLTLRSLGVTQGDEVIVQAYTCVVVINAITALGAIPVYADINPETLCATKESILRCKTAKTACVIYQYTFGVSGDIFEVAQWCKKEGIPLVEDAAHAFLGKSGDRFFGTIGDAGIFSFGSEKGISAVRLGAVVTNRPDIARDIIHMRENLPSMGKIKEIKHLIHPILFFIGQRYYLHLGKMILFIAQHVGIIPRILTKEEKMGQWPKKFPCKPPVSLVRLLVHELADASRIIALRKASLDAYREALQSTPLCVWGDSVQTPMCSIGFPVRAQNQEDIIKHLKNANIYCASDWSGALIMPKQAHLPPALYPDKKNVPYASAYSQHILLLPVHERVDTSWRKKILSILDQHAEY
jgi:perosamine synthetase